MKLNAFSSINPEEIVPVPIEPGITKPNPLIVPNTEQTLISEYEEKIRKSIERADQTIFRRLDLATGKNSLNFIVKEGKTGCCYAGC